MSFLLRLSAFAMFLLNVADYSSCHSAYPPNYDREKGLLFDFYPAQKLNLPKGAMKKTKYVADNMECVFACMGVHWCRSTNFKIAPRSNGLHACQLISSEQFAGKEYMEPSKAYNHYSVKNPCQEKPCHNGGKCVLQENRQHSHCECKKGFGGENCEKAKNCAEVLQNGYKQSGEYDVYPDDGGGFKVYCDQQTAGGGWTVFQRRKDGSVDFYRGWADYKNGFGDLKGEFWLGLDKIHRLTQAKRNRLRVEVGDVQGNSAYVEYDFFDVTNEKTNYKLSLGTYSENLRY
ncbi:Angiopoietin-related protein 7 [Exaiptasia diaphana]|nr:Angiopoietin-related protein 7 [Exaiptasia diaphana]